MKTIKFLTIVILSILLTKCSKESAIEGLIPTKIIVEDLNLEMPKNSNGTLNIKIDNANYGLFYINSWFGNNFSISLTPIQAPGNQTSTIGFNKFSGINYISTFTLNEEVAENLVYSGGGNITTGTFSGNNYFYTYNGIPNFGKEYYFGFKRQQASNTIPLYGWMLLRVQTDKVIIKKIAYIKNKTIKAGEE